MSKTVSTMPFVALAEALKAKGFVSHGTEMEFALNCVYTTSSELILRLGEEVLRVKRECKPLDSDLKKMIKQCLSEVRKAFPGFGCLSWLPFRR